jgi:NADP-dependent 3-hydroxy acid dehydrogenase YdfG
MLYCASETRQEHERRTIGDLAAGKVVCVTGVASGIGKVAAKVFAREGLRWPWPT